MRASVRLSVRLKWIKSHLEIPACQCNKCEASSVVRGDMRKMLNILLLI